MSAVKPAIMVAVLQVLVVAIFQEMAVVPQMFVLVELH
jgi:hypothetical protein